jgi:YfiH family protein
MIERQTAAALTAPAIAHGFFLRHGGVSEGIYASLNCGPGSRDEPDSVAENRRRLAAELGAGLTLVTLSQIHSATVHAAPLAARTANAHTEGDGLVTATPGVALGILTADCAPVLLADPEARVIGAAHAGWKGAVAGVLENTVAAMEELGAARARIRAAIGPAITQDNYEVGWELRDKVLEQGGLRMRKFFVPSARESHYRFDLKAYAAHRLAQAGIGAVETLPACTYPPENGFFSFRRATHRAEPDYGRQVSAIALRP